MNEFIRFLLGLETEVRQGLISAVIIMVLFTMMSLLSSVTGYWFLMLLITIPLVVLLRVYDVFVSDAILGVVALGLLLVALSGLNDNARAVATITAMVFVEGSALIIGVFVLTGALIFLGGFAIASTGMDVKEAPKPAGKAFVALAIAGFWLGLTIGSFGLATPYVPRDLTMISLVLVVLIVPGALALPSDVPFRVVFYITMTALIVVAMLAPWYVIASLGIVVSPEDFFRQPGCVYWFVVTLLTMTIVGLTFAMSGAYGVLTSGLGRAAAILVVAAGIYWYKVVGFAVVATIVAPLPHSDAWRLMLRGTVIALLLLWWVMGLGRHGVRGLTRDRKSVV